MLMLVSYRENTKKFEGIHNLGPTDGTLFVLSDGRGDNVLLTALWFFGTTVRFLQRIVVVTTRNRPDRCSSFLSSKAATVSGS